MRPPSKPLGAPRGIIPPTLPLLLLLLRLLLLRLLSRLGLPLLLPLLLWLLLLLLRGWLLLLLLLLLLLQLTQLALQLSLSDRHVGNLLPLPEVLLLHVCLLLPINLLLCSHRSHQVPHGRSLRDVWRALTQARHLHCRAAGGGGVRVA